MANFPNKVSVPTSIKHYSNIPLIDTHDTTCDFMDFNVAFSLEMAAKSGIEMTHNLFSRMTALHFPTYGDASFHSRAFFVPYRTIFPAWLDFDQDVVHTYSDNVSTLVPHVPLIANSIFVELFVNSEYGMADYVADYEPGSNVKYDIVFLYQDSNGVVSQGYNLTKRGGRFMRLLNSLGYKIDFNSLNPEDYYSALPLFSCAKVYYDWYYPSAYVQDLSATVVNNWFKYDKGQNGSKFEDVFTTQDLFQISEMVDKVCYDSDYFVSAWDNPNAPNGMSFSETVIPDITTYDDTSTVSLYDASGTPYINTASSSEGISHYALTALRSLTDYMKRHQIAGSRTLDRYLAEWGVALPAEKLNRSVFIGEYMNNQDISFGDVTSTSDTTNIGGAPLGAYAGKGISAGNSQGFDFDTEEAGHLIIVTTAVPRVTNVQGMDRTVKHLTRLDFYHADFDNLGVQAVGTKELYVPFDSTKQYTEFTPTYDYQGFDYGNLVFGFMPRYAEYKVGRDRVTGDYMYGSRNTGLDAWLLNRDLTPMVSRLGVEDLKHSRNFLLGTDSNQYNRIFNGVIDEDKEYSVDNFRVHHIFKYNLRFPGKSLFDNYEFYEEDKAQKVSLDVNGVKNN